MHSAPLTIINNVQSPHHSKRLFRVKMIGMSLRHCAVFTELTPTDAAVIRRTAMTQNNKEKKRKQAPSLSHLFLVVLRRLEV